MPERRIDRLHLISCRPSYPTHIQCCRRAKKACAGSFWWVVGKIKTLSGEPRSSKLHQLMAGLLTIPCSNADAERGFSVLRKVHTDQSLSQSTIITLMSIKMNNSDCCIDTELSDDLLTKCKNDLNSYCPFILVSIHIII